MNAASIAMKRRMPHGLRNDVLFGRGGSDLLRASCSYRLLAKAKITPRTTQAEKPMPKTSSLLTEMLMQELYPAM